MKVKKITAALLLTSFALTACAEEATAVPKTIFKNVNIFNGTQDKLIKGCNVVVENNLIKDACAKSVKAAKGDKVIDGQGMTLMPGMIDSHVHFYFSHEGQRPGWEQSRWDHIAAMGAAASGEWFADGFTTVRDMGGMLDGLRTVIDKGLLDGPRMYLSGPTISMSSGHTDMTFAGQDNKPEHSNLVRLQMTKIVDGEDEMRKAVRQSISLGSNIAKIMIGSGVAGSKSPMFSSQFTDGEIIAAVEEAERIDGYVAAHLYLDEHIQRALKLGVKTIEHGQFIQEDTARLLKEKGAYISPFLGSVVSDEILKHPVFGGELRDRTMEMKNGAKDFIKVMKKVKPKIVFSSDVVGSNGAVARQVRDFEKWVFAESFGNFEALKAMTSVGGELAMETGRGNPYPHKLGVIEKGAYADILLVDGNPLKDITVLGAHPVWFDAPLREKGIKTIQVIMKDGKIYKNTLSNK